MLLFLEITLLLANAAFMYTESLPDAFYSVKPDQEKSRISTPPKSSIHQYPGLELIPHKNLNDGKTKESTDFYSRYTTRNTAELQRGSKLTIIQPVNTNASRSMNIFTISTKQRKFSYKDLPKRASSNHRKQFNTHTLLNKENNQDNYSSHRRLTSQNLQITQKFGNNFSKYMKGEAESLPPSPELSRGTTMQQLPPPQNERSSNTALSGAAIRKQIEKQPIPNERGEYASKFSEREDQVHEITSSEKIHTSFLQGGAYILGMKEESIFQPLPFEKYDGLNPLPPFAELHASRKEPRRDDHDKRSVPVPNAGGSPERAGPELYPSSIFEKELRVPFF